MLCQINHSVKQLGLGMLVNLLSKFAYIQKGLYPHCGLSCETYNQYTNTMSDIYEPSSTPQLYVCQGE